RTPIVPTAANCWWSAMATASGSIESRATARVLRAAARSRGGGRRGFTARLPRGRSSHRRGADLLHDRQRCRAEDDLPRCPDRLGITRTTDGFDRNLQHQISGVVGIWNWNPEPLQYILLDPDVQTGSRLQETERQSSQQVRRSGCSGG